MAVYSPAHPPHAAAVSIIPAYGAFPIAAAAGAETLPRPRQQVGVRPGKSLKMK